MDNRKVFAAYYVEKETTKHLFECEGSGIHHHHLTPEKIQELIKKGGLTNNVKQVEETPEKKQKSCHRPK